MRYWKRTNTDHSTGTVESYSHHLDIIDAIEITEKEFTEFINSLPPPAPEVNRIDTELSEIKAEIASLKARLDALVSR